MHWLGSMQGTAIGTATILARYCCHNPCRVLLAEYDVTKSDSVMAEIKLFEEQWVRAMLFEVGKPAD